MKVSRARLITKLAKHYVDLKWIQFYIDQIDQRIYLSASRGVSTLRTLGFLVTSQGLPLHNDHKIMNSLRKYYTTQGFLWEDRQCLESKQDNSSPINYVSLSWS